MDQPSDDLELEIAPTEAPASTAASPAVLVSSQAFDEMTQHALEEAEHEIGGIMVGSVVEGTGTVVIIEDVIRGTHMTHSRGSVTFTHESWTEINRVKDERFADKRVVGWYHSHPGFGIFLSNHDLFIHENFFNLPWQVAFVTDPRASTCGCFVWQDKTIVQDLDFGVLTSPQEHLSGRSKPTAPAPAPTASAPQATQQPVFNMPAPTPVLRRDPGLSWALGILAMLVALAVGLSLGNFDAGRRASASIQALNVKLDTIVSDMQELRSAVSERQPAAQAESREPASEPKAPPPAPTPAAVPPEKGDSGAGSAPPSP
ncbi:MAG: Mov34/MPN/PAD-1 family protein [Armatimonadia bacterium]